ncbi:MAG: magnesium transporter [Magnetococcales bacterium]|nr:magnesium transporter [Magnetococcales bacterium]
MSMMILEDEKKADQPTTNSRIVDAVNRLYRKGSTFHLTQLLGKLKPLELAQVLDDFPEHKSNALFALVKAPELAARVLMLVTDGLRNHLLTHCELEKALAVMENLSRDERNRCISGMDEESAKRLMEAMRQEPQEEGEDLLQYKQGTAGSLMTTSIFALPEMTTAAEAIDAIQDLSDHDSVFYLYMVDDLKRLTGVCSIRKLILSDPDKPLKEFAQSRLIKVHIDTPQGEVANQVSKYRLLAVPVVDDDGVLIGQIAIDDLVHVIQEEHTESLMKMAGVDKKASDVMSQTPLQIFKTRVPWLVTAFVAYLLVSAILGGFEETLERVVQLSFFFPIVIGMAGNAGSQTGAVVVRGLALGLVNPSHYFKLLAKELGANVVQGGVYGLALAVAAYLIFQNVQLSMVVGPALVANITASSFIALSLPFFFKRLGADPAVAAGPLALAFIDLVGSTNYLVIAFLVYGF